MPHCQFGSCVIKKKNPAFSIISPHWTKSKTGAYGFGLYFHVRAFVHNHISDKYGPILFELGTKTTHDGPHKHVILFQDRIKDGRLVAILVLKKLDVEHVLNHFSDIHLPMFKLGTQITNDGLHKHVTLFFRDQIQDGWLVAILLFNRIPNHFLNIHGPILGCSCQAAVVRFCSNLAQTQYVMASICPSLYFVI